MKNYKNHRKEPITKPGETIIVKMETPLGAEICFFAHVNNVTRDFTTKNRIGWIVNFLPLLPVVAENLANNEPTNPMEWKVNDEHIYGEAFTINNLKHQFLIAKFTENIQLTKEPEQKSKRKDKPNLTLVK